MSTEVKEGEITPDPTQTPEDPIKQLKGEFNRKMSESNKLVEQLSATQNAINQKLEALVNPRQAPAKEEPLDRMMYTDPKRFTQTIKEQAKQEALEQMRVESQGQGAIKDKIAALAAEYPELSDQNAELTKASVEILKAANALERNNPVTYEYAVMKAAQQLDIKPKSKRPIVEEDFVAASYSSPQNRGKRKSEDAVIKEGRDSAKAFGINLDDPKTKARYLKIMKDKGLA